MSEIAQLFCHIVCGSIECGEREVNISLGIFIYSILDYCYEITARISGERK